MVDWICLKCQHFEQEEIEAYWQKDLWGGRRWVQNTYRYFCNEKQRYIRLVSNRCSNFFPLTQTKLVVRGDGMVKIDEIPSEGQRVDLGELPPEADLIALKEDMKAEAIGKTGGLVITYQLKDSRTFQQKYSKVSGAELAAACKKLNIKDTADLQKNWYHYKLTQMRIGFPRMIPVSKAKAEGKEG